MGHPEQQQQQQQHWLFHSELDLINEIHPNLAGTGKSVDMNDPILPNSMPRDYGGVAILWKKSIDQYIRPTSDGSERIQCIEINTETSHLIINVYLPTKSNNDQFDTYSDCFDQLYEIVQKYSINHEIIIAGDFNEDISTKISNSRRAVKLRTYMAECNLATNTKDPTFVNVSGIDVSEIDYFLFNKTKAYTSKRIIDVPTNVSDHHPIKIEIECSLKRNTNTNDKLRV